MKKYTQVNNFYLDKDEEFLLKDIIPEYFMDMNLDKQNISADCVLNFLQNEMNGLLHSFLNGNFSYKGYILFPIIKDISKVSIKRLDRLKKIAVFLNDNNYDFSSSIKKYRQRVGSKNFAAILSALYDDFSRIKNKNTRIIKKPRCKELDLKSYKKSDSGYLKPLKDLKSYANGDLRQFLLGFYLHGSLATNDYVKGWSDVDTLAVISKETIENPKNLLKLRDELYRMRHFFCRIDPLQHHGSIIVSEYDIENYCQPYFPIAIYNYAKSFFKNEDVGQFRVRDSSSESIRRLFWFVNYFRKSIIEKRFNLGSYDTKVFLHSVTLFPAMYLQAKGINVYKKFSFDLAKKEFDKRIWSPIDKISSIRKKWRIPNKIPLTDLVSGVNPLLAYQLNSRYWDVFHNINRLNKINVRKLAVEMHALAESAWAKIKI